MVRKEERIAIIPARGGSKRIPQKNIIDFFDKPMIAYTIEAGLFSDVFDDVMVSTDSETIADIAKEHGASIPFLRNRHMDDHSTVSDVIVHTLKRLEQEMGKKYKEVCMLMPNCPLRTAEDIKRQYKEFQDKQLKFQISAFEFGWMNPWWAHAIDDSGRATPFFEKATKTRSQDLENLYCPTGASWLASVPDLIESKTFYGPGYHFSIMNWKSAVDIDDYDDLEMAKAIYLLKKNSSKQQSN